MVRRHGLLVLDWRPVLHGARRPGKRRSWTDLLRPPTKVKSQQTETPPLVIAGGKGTQTVLWRPAAVKGSVLLKTATVEGVAGDAKLKLG